MFDINLGRFQVLGMPGHSKISVDLYIGIDSTRDLRVSPDAGWAHSLRMRSQVISF